MPGLAILLPDIALVATLTGLRFLQNDNPVTHLAIALTCGALAACVWSNIRLFLFEQLDERKLRAILIGASGAAVASLLYLVFGSWLLELHELFFFRRRSGLGPPFTDMALTFMYLGIFGAVVSLVIDHGWNKWR